MSLAALRVLADTVRLFVCVLGGLSTLEVQEVRRFGDLVFEGWAVLAWDSRREPETLQAAI